MSKNGDPGGGPGLKMAPDGPNLMRIWPTACLIWSENRILDQKAIPGDFFCFFQRYWSYKRIMKISKFYFGPGSPKKRCLRFFLNFLREKSGIRESRVRRRFRESRVRRRKPGIYSYGGQTDRAGSHSIRKLST